MFEKLFAMAMMVAVVGTIFHFFGAADAGPRAVIAPAPIVATADMPEFEDEMIE